MDNVGSVLDTVGDAEPHILKFWDAGYFSNALLVDPTINETEMSTLVGGCFSYIALSKHTSVTFLNVC